MASRKTPDWVPQILEPLADHPVLLALIIPLCVLAYRADKIIASIGVNIREGRKNKVEVRNKQAILAKKLESETTKRARKSGAKKP